VTTRLSLAGLATAFAVTVWVQPWADERVTDMWVYRADAAGFLHGQLPYRDVFFEYPPLAAPVIALPGVGGTGIDGYRIGFGALAVGPEEVGSLVEASDWGLVAEG
jgi:hypothetical protein